MEDRHFSHPHSLTIYPTKPGEISCSGCGLPCSNSVYGCLQCWFCLDEQCFNAKRSLDHPSHPLHHLTLLPSPTYTNGSFQCNACSGAGTAFSFCCSKCEFDLHVHCASLPQTFSQGADHPHDLSLYYGGSQQQGSCKICHQVLDAKLWSYRCSPCNFYVHTYCLTNAGRPRAPQTRAHAGHALSAAPSSAFQSDPLVDARVRLSQNQIARSMESINMLAEIGTTNYKRKPYNSWSSNSNPFGGIG